jgi:hypothetical protein
MTGADIPADPTIGQETVMIYVQRDSEGRITALFNTPNEHASEAVPVNSAEVKEFLMQDETGDEASREILSQMDLEMVRITEDLIELLISKNLIMFTDLPPAAQQKLLSRKKLRLSLSSDDQLLVDVEELF